MCYYLYQKTRNKHYIVQKFDKEGIFLKKYLPNLDSLSDKEIHNPSIESREKLHYPSPITDLSFSRKRAIEVFSKI